MKHKFYMPGWILSMLLAFVAGSILFTVKPSGTMAYILWAGSFLLILLVVGFIGMQLAFLLSRTYRLQRPKGWLAVFLICALLIFGVGCGGQALFMIDKEEVTIGSSVDMVLLLDASGSMEVYGYNAPRTDAANQFVNSLDDTSRLQVVSFAGRVIDSTALMTMDAAGKQAATQMINSIDSTGATDFNDPLRMAMDTLTAQARPDSNKVVILLTDGEGDLDAAVERDLLSNGILVFTIRITSSTHASAQEQALIDLAQASGGFDTKLTPKANGSVDASALLTAFQDAFKASTEEKTLMRESLLICSETTTLYQFVIRLVTLVLCAVLFGFAYYGWCGMGKLLLNAGSGALLAVLITAVGGEANLCVWLACLLLAASYASLDVDGGGMLDV